MTWTPVEESLPEHLKWVLATDGKYFRPSYCYNGDWLSLSYSTRVVKLWTITHWTDLPDDYEIKENKVYGIYDLD